MTKKRKLITMLSLASAGAITAGSTVAGVLSAQPAAPAASVETGAQSKTLADAKTVTIDGGAYKYQSADSAAPDYAWSLLYKYGDATIYAPNLAFSPRMAAALLPGLAEGKTWQTTPRARVIYQRFADVRVRSSFDQSIDGSTIYLDYPVQFSFQDAPPVADGDTLVITFRAVNEDGTIDATNYEVVYRLYRSEPVPAVQGQNKSVTSDHKVVGSLARFYDLAKLAGNLPKVNEGYQP